MQHYFSAKGVLANKLPGFVPRKPQQTLAQAVADVIRAGENLIAEAQTGTGKTLAYLVPALMSGKKVLLSTGSKTLQAQLAEKDLPAVVEALQYQGRIALLKGRANYLCLLRMYRFAQQIDKEYPAALNDWHNVRRWASHTLSGDLAEVPDLAEGSALLPLITSTNDNCLGRQCEQFESCYLVKARKAAMDADVVVINHHLFFADMAVRDTGFGELVPSADVVVFDEAHQLSDIAVSYFGQQLGAKQLLDLCRDLQLLYRTELRDTPQLEKSAQALVYAVRDFRLALGSTEQFKVEWDELATTPKVMTAFSHLNQQLAFVRDVCKSHLGRADALDQCFDRAATYLAYLNQYANSQTLGISRWLDVSANLCTWHLTPLSVAERFATMVQQRGGSWIFMSATLSVGGDLGYFAQQLGLTQARLLCVDSPFDYQRQALFYLPRYLPSLQLKNRVNQLITQVLPIINKNRGRCFVLCTSHVAMQQFAQGLRLRLAYPVLMQGEASKQQLLAQYKAAQHAVLCATQSFWEGVDVQGQLLSCVIIDKLPFAAPDDPLLKARIDDCKRRGEDGFAQVQLPKAAITLKQGAGRLIRDVQDRGVLVICDPRLASREYGAAFIASLPPMARTRDLSQVLTFIETMYDEVIGH